jgi:anthranilate synthase/phosphoribosyltransferase
VYIIIDNYDSFTYNLFQYLKEVITDEVKVFRNDKVSIQEIEEIGPQGIVISPGPGRPEEAGISVEVVKHFAGKIPILGVCLGHQAIGYAFGASITTARNIVHGKTDLITMDGKGLFRNIPSPSSFTRYHSLVISKSSVPEELIITAYSTDGEIMGIRHTQYPIEGIQFHPESIASEYGRKILQNFINYKREPFHIKSALLKITSGENLSPEEASSFMEELTDGQLTQNQIAAFLTALSTKKINSSELASFAAVLGKKKKSLSVQHPLLDTCGTGGDGKSSFNISSMAAIVASSCGAYVAKHGNRSVSSRSGSAEFYKELGIPIELEPEEVKLLLEETGFAFLFAPLYHGSMRHAAQVRRELGIKTVMNILGPLLNPASAEYQLVGVYSAKLCEPVAETLGILGRKRAMVVHGLDGFDEISVSAPTKICEIKSGGEKKQYLFDPEELGIKKYKENDLKGGTPAENAVIAEEILSSEGREAIKEAVLLNTGAALYIYNLSESIKDGYILAKETLESGKALAKLEQIRETGNRLIRTMRR